MSIYYQECIFCKSYKKYKVENLILFENKKAYSIFNYKPSTPAHALIVTKEHIFDLRTIKGDILKDFIQAIPLTFEAIQAIYDKQPKKIIEFYERIIANPPEQEAAFFTKQVLEHPNLEIKPIAYNWGMNCGYEAGQRAVHLHIHLFPRREEGLGIASAMRKHLTIE